MMNIYKDTLKKYGFQMLLIIAFSAASFYVGGLYTKVKIYEGDNAKVAGANIAKANNDTGTAAKTDVDKPSSKDHTRGSKDAQLAIIEYSDFSCPFCKQFHTTMTQVMSQYAGKIKWIHRNFPLVQLHPNAFKQAIAAECVAKISGEDKFWQYVDKLYTAETSPDVTALKTMASALGVDSTKFNTCLDNDETKAVVTADQQSASKAGVTGTPGNFLMNIKTGEIVPIKGAVPFDSLKVTIDSMLNK